MYVETNPSFASLPTDLPLSEEVEGLFPREATDNRRGPSETGIHRFGVNHVNDVNHPHNPFFIFIL